MRLNPGDLDREITFERNRKVGGFGKAGQDAWQPVATVWAQVRDVLPSRAEQSDDGLTIATRRARIRMWNRDDITPDMRVLVGARVMQIIAGPAEIGDFREGIELMAEDYSTAGTGA